MMIHIYQTFSQNTVSWQDVKILNVEMETS